MHLQLGLEDAEVAEGHFSNIVLPHFGGRDRREGALLRRVHREEEARVYQNEGAVDSSGVTHNSHLFCIHTRSVIKLINHCRNL